MARPRKTVAPVEAVDGAITISKTPIEGEVVQAVEPVEVVAVTRREDMVKSLSKLFPKAPFAEYNDELIEALYTQHIGTVHLTV